MELFSGKHLVCMERLFTAFSGKNGALLLVNTTAESLFELARGSGLLYVLVVDLKLCNQE